MVSRSLAPAGFPTALIVSPATSSPGRLQRALRVLRGTLFLARPAPAVTLWPGAAVASLPLHPDGSCPGCPPHLPPECSPLRHVRSWYRSPAPLAQPRDTTSQPLPSSPQAHKGHGVLTERQGGDPRQSAGAPSLWPGDSRPHPWGRVPGSPRQPCRHQQKPGNSPESTARGRKTTHGGDGA